ncbi:DHH family phosphoesterase [Candidatus Saccharibacteria bacterium]|nr:DHH family phosphoesterase [Candidatus Saccharibacteria bacterium]
MEEQKKQYLEFQHFVENSKKILITSHISPDPDAVCSTLLLGRSLKLEYPSKNIEMVIEEQPARDISFLEGYGDIKFNKLLEIAKEIKPDLIIIADAMNYERVSRSDGAAIRELAREELGSKLIIIDHHTEIGLESSNLYINNHLPATVQEIYELLFNSLGLEKPSGFAEATLLGIITDTSRFKYDNPKHRQTFGLVSDLLDAGASIESLEYRLDRYSILQMKAVANLSKNITDSGRDYSYSFIDDDLKKDASKNPDDFKMACEEFTNGYVRNIDNNYWGFIVYPEFVNGDTVYSVSFRSVGGHKDVSLIAGMLGGGGHKAAAGAKFSAKNIEDALDKVRQAVEDSG